MDIGDIISKVEGRVAQPLEVRQNFAVLIPLVKKGNQWQIVYELRAKNLKRQPGEISFPGGEVERGETFKEAAIRETIEELNIEKENIDIIGELDYIVTTSNIAIYPFLGVINNINVDNIRPNKHEVDHIFTVPINFFINNEPKLYYIDLHPVISKDFPYTLIPNGEKYKWRFGKYSVYFYSYNDYIIWGYTAKLTKHFIDLIK
ncbi:NUDIX hydrolase [Tepidimicrobium xylanilyticum]|uniref:NUDIX hydrolase n=1 Tax=Tepidimicrobium xylanilyticum TaxID=1123352 RepID=UPI00264C4B5F|nr:CoA pyrophosphatase [Tepidimicrobium xylanilyticum]GMG97531.1 coenzyme A pyrophosphatase [Tepidimicrobium xylanilyticum]